MIAGIGGMRGTDFRALDARDIRQNKLMTTKIQRW